jgi:hypothetical protein
LAGRMNAAAISHHDHQRPLDERQQLLDKELAGSITRHEINRLQYIRWSLDRVDDARYGMGLEMLENAVARYERFRADIEHFYSELQGLKKSGRKRLVKAALQSR